MTSMGNPKKSKSELFLVISLVVIVLLSICATYYSTFYLKNIEIVNQDQNNYESE
jgi:flagellar basal body-associated protein FliL